MPDVLISDFNLPLKDGVPDSHVMRAVQAIIRQLKLVPDDSQIPIFGDNVEHVRWTQSSIYRPDAPYALVSIVTSGGQELTGQGTQVWAKTPVQIAAVFSANDSDTESTVQAWASSLGARISNYLDEYTVDNPTGIDFTKEAVPNPPGVGTEVWQWHNDSKWKETLDRKVMQANNATRDISGSRWRYLMERTIRTFPTTPLR